jgi:hypothetical protein
MVVPTVLATMARTRWPRIAESLIAGEDIIGSSCSGIEQTVLLGSQVVKG